MYLATVIFLFALESYTCFHIDRNTDNCEDICKIYLKESSEGHELGTELFQGCHCNGITLNRGRRDVFNINGENCLGICEEFFRDIASTGNFAERYRGCNCIMLLSNKRNGHSKRASSCKKYCDSYDKELAIRGIYTETFGACQCSTITKKKRNVNTNVPTNCKKRCESLPPGMYLEGNDGCPSCTSNMKRKSHVNQEFLKDASLKNNLLDYLTDIVDEDRK